MCSFRGCVGAQYAIPATLGGSLPVFMPVSWMAATHRWLGLGEMPTGPIVEYLDTFQADHDFIPSSCPGS